MFFLENCYFSMSKQNWSDSVTACQDVGAQLVIIESNKEKVYLLKSPSYSEA
jgi:CD209 antigen